MSNEQARGGHGRVVSRIPFFSGREVLRIFGRACCRRFLPQPPPNLVFLHLHVALPLTRQFMHTSRYVNVQYYTRPPATIREEGETGWLTDGLAEEGVGCVCEVCESESERERES